MAASIPAPALNRAGLGRRTSSPLSDTNVTAAQLMRRDLYMTSTPADTPLTRRRASSTFRQQDVTKAIRAVTAAGVGIAKVEIDKAGKITIIALGVERSSESRKKKTVHFLSLHHTDLRCSYPISASLL